jgi:hypothetical protein
MPGQGRRVRAKGLGMTLTRRVRCALLAVPLAAALMSAAPAALAAGGGYHPQQHPGPAVQVRPAIAPSALAGYLWSDSTSGGYYGYDSTGGAISESVPVTGITQVSFAGLQGIGDTAGDVQVTPYGTADTCAVSGWGPLGSAELIDVACYAPNGALATTPPEFDVTITKPTGKPSGVYDYAWISTDNKSVSLKNAFGEYNSSHKANSVVHLGTGRYEVIFPGPKSKGEHGTVEVTPFLRQSATGANCVTASWKGTRTGEDVYVDCYAPSGVRQNDAFDVVYASASNVLGLNKAADANTLFSGKGPIGLPVTAYFSNSHAKADDAEGPLGFYIVLLPGSGGNFADFGGDVQAEAVSSNDVHCTSGGWDQGALPTLDVACYGRTGHQVSTPFELQWIVP